MTYKDRKRTIYERRLAELMEELEAVYVQLGQELNEANKLKLKRQADGLEQEIATLEEQLQQFNTSSVAHADPEPLVRLVDQINRYFNLREVRDLCFRLGIDYEDLGGEGKSGQVRELVMVIERNGRLPQLLTLLKKLRDHVNWK